MQGEDKYPFERFSQPSTRPSYLWNHTPAVGFLLGILGFIIILEIAALSLR